MFLTRSRCYTGLDAAQYNMADLEDAAHLVLGLEAGDTVADRAEMGTSSGAAVGGEVAAVDGVDVQYSKVEAAAGGGGEGDPAVGGEGDAA